VGISMSSGFTGGTVLVRLTNALLSTVSKVIPSKQRGIMRSNRADHYKANTIRERGVIYAPASATASTATPFAEHILYLELLLYFSLLVYMNAVTTV
jgi:hypothetical protein